VGNTFLIICEPIITGMALLTPRIHAYVETLHNNWKLVLIIFSIVSLLYTMHVYSQYNVKTLQDEYIKGGASATTTTGPYDWIKTIALTGIFATLIQVLYYYATTWGWLEK
jgi:membrane protein implicated in regulation of membrane protease activity